MKRLIYVGLYTTLFTSLTCCNGQPKNNNQSIQKTTTDKSKIVGGGCDGCELMYIGMPTVIHSSDTSSSWYEKGQRLLVAGRVYKSDGKTPAPTVIIYYWQTNNTGIIPQNREWTKKPKGTAIFVVG